MTLFRHYNENSLHVKVAKNYGSYAAMAIMAVMMFVLNTQESGATPFAPLPLPDLPNIVDTTAYSRYTYVRFVDEQDSMKLSDEEFFDIAGKVIFPINKWTLPKRDSLVMQLEKEVFPLINRDSLELVYMMLRGAASPEGPTRWNKTLGERRAETMLNFIKTNLTAPINENFDMEIDIEDYRTLCIMMRRMGDKDYGYVQAMCDQYLPKGQIDKLKSTLRAARQGTLWLRLFREYFPRLRAARIVFFFRTPRTYAPKVLPETPVEVVNKREKPEEPLEPEEPEVPDVPVVPVTPVVPEVAEQTQPERLPRREFLSLKTNLLFDVAYVPGYNRWCPIPNLAVEYYPKHGHFTYGASIDFPWWQHYWKHKYFQIRNYQLEARYYFRRGDIELNPPGKGAAFRGLYLQAYGHAAIFDLCFDANRGWTGEGGGGGLGIGYVLPLSKKGHWKLEFQLQAGAFVCKYDPYQYTNPKTGEDDGLYYYKWTQSKESFVQRQYRFTWIGPTRVGVTLSYDLLYRRINKKGISFRPWEDVTLTSNTKTDEENTSNSQSTYNSK